MELGRKIADARREKGMTQEQLAELMGVTRQTVSRWESQSAYPEMEKMVKLAKLLEVSCDYLLNDQVRKDQGSIKSKPEADPVTRLLENAKGKTVRILFYSDAMDFDIHNKKSMITEFDGRWVHVFYKNGKKTESKLVPISGISSIKFEKEAETWSFSAQ